ncbi:MAG: PEGA domain-containing protein [Acidobacteria bacterium]|nr:PEGA domain-containing protein [Acidobacteriota bacterium]
MGQTEVDQSDKKRATASEKQINSDLKLLLNDYYAGKPVRAKIVIPANERGVEVLDGQLKIYPLPELTTAVQPGEMILIKELRFKNKEIEVRFDGEQLKEAVTTSSPTSIPGLTPVGPHGSDATTGPPPAALVAKTPKTIKSLPDPRVVLRFSRDIETRDLNLQSINRLLSPAVDVTALTPTTSLEPQTTVPPRPTANEAAQQSAVGQGIPIAPVTGELIGASTSIGELVIQCSTPGARLYIDGTYSGTVPRTVQLLMGVHTILIVAPGQNQFEQKFFLPAGKIATIKADLSSR